MLASSELALFKRFTFIAHYLRPSGVFARLMRRKTLLFLWQGTKALFLTLVLLISATSFDMNQWMVLLADIVLMTALAVMMTWLVRSEVKPDYAEPLAHNWAHRINATLLWLSSVLVMFYTPHENYQGMHWEDVVHFSATQVMVACDTLAVLARLNAVSEALAWWAAQNFLDGLERPAQVLMAWIAFIASFGISFLIAWAYSRALTGVLAKPWRFFSISRPPGHNHGNGLP
ncbi:MAG: hypothetical protein ABFS45_03625 [Pseudomonadota bacterium]